VTSKLAQVKNAQKLRREAKGESGTMCDPPNEAESGRQAEVTCEGTEGEIVVRRGGQRTEGVGAHAKSGRIVSRGF
jgi:hypothetical protein